MSAPKLDALPVISSPAADLTEPYGVLPAGQASKKAEDLTESRTQRPLRHQATTSQTVHLGDTIPLKGARRASQQPDGTYREAAPQLHLSTTYACNLSCTYCSFRSRMAADGRPVSMPDSVASEAIGFCREHLEAVGARHLRVDFGLTGESLLRPGNHDDLYDMVQSTLQDLPVRSARAGVHVTNGTLGDGGAGDGVVKPPQDVSLDGPRDVHDAVRRRLNGAGSYDAVAEMARRSLARHPDVGVSCVLTARATDFTRIFRHLYEEIGFRSIYMKPVNLPPGDSLALDFATLPNFIKGYRELISFLSSGSDAEVLDKLGSLDREDFFMRYFYRVRHGDKMRHRCGAGRSGVYVDTDGALFPCAHFIGKKGHEVGSVHNGFDEESLKPYRVPVDERPTCASCPAMWQCGGCHYQAVLANGDSLTPDEAKCDLIRFLVSQARTLIGELAESRPDVLAALPATAEFSKRLYHEGETSFDSFSLVDAGNRVGLGNDKKYGAVGVCVGHESMSDSRLALIVSAVERAAVGAVQQTAERHGGIGSLPQYSAVPSPASWQA